VLTLSAFVLVAIIEEAGEGLGESNDFLSPSPGPGIYPSQRPKPVFMGFFRFLKRPMQAGWDGLRIGFRPVFTEVGTLGRRSFFGSFCRHVFQATGAYPRKHPQVLQIPCSP
jgi:hypothetical protein